MSDKRVALCRCGGSANKPHCDNAHRALAFRDAGEVNDPDAVQDAGPGPSGERLVVMPEPDGPLHLAGPLVVASADGAVLLEGTSAWLCRCGRSQDKPFCDGSHTTTNFRSTPAKR
jgi:CDGSH-type Zn-finger protein